MMSNLKVETDNKEKALAIIAKIIESKDLHTITTKRCNNGDYSVEIVNSSDYYSGQVGEGFLTSKN